MRALFTILRYVNKKYTGRGRPVERSCTTSPLLVLCERMRAGPPTTARSWITDHLKRIAIIYCVTYVGLGVPALVGEEHTTRAARVGLN